MNKILTTCLLGLVISLPCHAGTMGDMTQPIGPKIYVGAYGGYGSINGDYRDDGDFGQGRLALGVQAFDFSQIALGAEIGVQSGNTMRLAADPLLIETAGGLPIQSVLKPVVDVLITAKGRFSPASPFSVILKGGIAYRQLQLMDRTSAQDSLSKVNGELQAGLGFNLSERTMVTAFYQGIYSDENAGISLNTVGDVVISRIPTQQAGFIGLEHSFW